MRKLRDIFYINANFEEKYFEYYGMEFSEFIRFIPTPIENILVTEPWLMGGKGNHEWHMGTYNGKQMIEELSGQFLYSLGNFKWIDYSDDQSLNSCSESEKAEVLYLSHFGTPLRSAFLSSIENQFVYLAHDDGWYCKLYCKDMAVFGDVIANKIIAFFSTNKRRKISPMEETIKKDLLELTKKGLRIDFAQASVHNNQCYLHFDTIGEYHNMDEMYHSMDEKIQIFSKSMWLEHKNKKWEFHSVE